MAKATPATRRPGPTGLPGELPASVKAAAKAKAAKLEGVAATPDQEKENARLLLEALDMFERGKALLEESDKRVDILVKTLGPGVVVKIDERRSAFLVDAFEDRNVVWRSHASRRYSVTVVKRSGKPA